MSGMRSFSNQELIQIKTILTNPRDYCLFVLGYRTGFRISELLSLTVDSVYSNNKVRDTIKVWRRDMKGGVSSREIPLHSEAKEAIEKYLFTLIIKNSKAKLFKSRQDSCMSRSRAIGIYKEIASKLQLSGSIATHSARKTLAGNVYKASGNNLLVTQRALGHASITSTIKYIDVNKEEVDNIILGLE